MYYVKKNQPSKNHINGAKRQRKELVQEANVDISKNDFVEILNT